MAACKAGVSDVSRAFYGRLWSRSQSCVTPKQIIKDKRYHKKTLNLAGGGRDGDQ